jgi:hypothetical protein
MASVSVLLIYFAASMNNRIKMFRGDIVSSHSTVEMFKKIKALEDEDPTDLTTC